MRGRLLLACLVVLGTLAGAFAYRIQAQQAAPMANPMQLEQNARRGMLLIAEPQQTAAPAAAPAPVQPPGPVYVVTFVDITPNNRDAGTAYCKQYVADTRKDPGITRAELLAQTNRPNHLVIYQVWQNQAAFERHEAAAHTKAFRAKMAPIIGSPFDQRPHYVVQ